MGYEKRDVSDNILDIILMKTQMNHLKSKILNQNNSYTTLTFRQRYISTRVNITPNHTLKYILPV